MGQTGKASSNPIKETRADALSISAIRARTHHATRTNDGWEAMLAQACSRSALPFFGHPLNGEKLPRHIEVRSEA
jgi:hypothetical protein